MALLKRCWDIQAKLKTHMMAAAKDKQSEHIATRVVVGYHESCEATGAIPQY